MSLNPTLFVEIQLFIADHKCGWNKKSALSYPNELVHDLTNNIVGKFFSWFLLFQFTEKASRYTVFIVPPYLNYFVCMLNETHFLAYLM